MKFAEYAKRYFPKINNAIEKIYNTKLNIVENSFLKDYYSELKDFFPDEYNQAMKLMIKGKEILYRLIELETQKKIDVGYLSGKLDFFYDVEKAEVEYKNWEKIALYDIELD